MMAQVPKMLHFLEGSEAACLMGHVVLLAVGRPTIIRISNSSLVFDLTVPLALLIQGKVLDDGKVRKDRTVGPCHLPEFELHWVILHQDMRLECLAPQDFLVNSERNAYSVPILGEGKFHVNFTFKVYKAAKHIIL